MDFLPVGAAEVDDMASRVHHKRIDLSLPCLVGIDGMAHTQEYTPNFVLAGNHLMDSNGTRSPPAIIVTIYDAKNRNLRAMPLVFS